MMKQKSEQTVQKIKADVQGGHYSLKRISEEDRDPSRTKRMKKLCKKRKKAKEAATEEKMLLLFKLGKELGEEYERGGNKNYKMIARKLYKSFRKSYLWISI